MTLSKPAHALWQYLTTNGVYGPERAITQDRLIERLGIVVPGLDRRRLQRARVECIRAGRPVLGRSGINGGYYIPRDWREARPGLCEMRKRARTTYAEYDRACDACRDYWRVGQARLFAG